jgi:hypothetical protein
MARQSGTLIVDFNMAPALKQTKHRLLAAIAMLAGFAMMAGCGAGPATETTSISVALHGVVHGGQPPVAGSVIHLYSAGKGGNGTAARDMLSVAATVNGVPTTVDYVTTDSNGNFNITGDYSCNSSSDQVYITASGGNPGQGGSVNNAALVMVAALGSCVNVPGISNIYIDEVTTAAAAWALAPFMTSAANVASSSTNTTGIANAFADAQLLANSTNGQPAILASTQVVETGKLYALANALGGCINSDGTTACGPLFAAATPPGGNPPTDTLSAALNIVKNPGYHVTNVYNAIPTQPAYPSQLPQAPSDWTMTMTVYGGGIYDPTGLGVDPQGEVWVADYYGGLTGYTPQGLPLSGSPFGVGTPQSGDYAPDGEGHGELSEVYGLAVNTAGNIWVTVEEQPNHNGTAGSVVGFYGASSGHSLGSTIGQYYDNSLDYPESLAPDKLGNIYIGNYASGSVTVYNGSGGLVANGLGTYVASGSTASDAAFPVSIAPDGLGGAWLSNNDQTVTHADAAGHLYRPTCCDDVDGIVADAQGNGWASNYFSSSVSEVSPGSTSNGVYTPGTVLLNQQTGGGLSYPAHLTVDAGQSVWVANYHGQTISQIAAVTGTVVSPITGYGKDAAMFLPYSITPDASGNLWVSDFGKNALVMFFGLATPTSMPMTPPQTAP